MDITVCIVQRTMMMPSDRNSMLQHLNQYFESVSNRPRGQNHNVTINYVRRNRCPVLGARDVIVYLVQDGNHSAFPADNRASNSTGHGGFTRLDLPAPGSTGHGRYCASEVYIQAAHGSLLAKLIFHEILHYKTGWGNSSLHNHHRGGLAQARLSVGDEINDDDLDLMAEHLHRARRAWLGGCT